MALRFQQAAVTDLSNLTVPSTGCVLVLVYGDDETSKKMAQTFTQLATSIAQPDCYRYFSNEAVAGLRPPYVVAYREGRQNVVYQGSASLVTLTSFALARACQNSRGCAC